jgi:hypothetical protein
MTLSGRIQVSKTGSGRLNSRRARRAYNNLSRKGSSMRLLATTFCSLALAFTIPAAYAQKPTQVRGAISAFDGRSLSIKAADGTAVTVEVPDTAEIIFNKPVKIADINSGDFLAVTSMKREDGSLTAYEVRRFPKPLNPGHRPFQGKSDQTMTNASVSAMVQSATGRELTLTYDGGSQKVVVPENAAIYSQVPGERSQLTPGATVFLNATAGEGGKLSASRIQVSPARK